MDSRKIAFALAVFVLVAAVAVYFYGQQNKQPTDCALAKTALESFISSSKECAKDQDCAVVYYSCNYYAVRTGAVESVALLQKKVDLCYPVACEKSVFSYDAYCDGGQCKTIVNGYTDKLYEDLVLNRTECSNSNVSGYADTDHCFLALRLKTKYKPAPVQEMICKQIVDARVRADCLSIQDKS